MTRVVYTVEETAELLGVSRAHVFRLINDGRLRSIKLGRCRRVPADAITTLLAADDVAR